MSSQATRPIFKDKTPHEPSGGPLLQDVLQASPGLIYVFNPKTMTNEYVNRGLGEELGYTEDEVQAFGADLIPSLVHPDEMPTVMAHFERMTTLADGDVAQVEYRCRHKAGHWIWLSAREMVFDRAPDGSVAMHIGVACDITRQKEAEERAIAEKRLAQVANKDLATFAYSVSHEMKAPSNTLAMILNELLDQHGGAFSDDARYLLDLAVDSVTRMQLRVEDVLEMTRCIGDETGASRVCLNDTIAKVVADLGAEFERTKAEIDVPELPDITAKPTQIYTLFQNLIRNALRFERPGYPPNIKIIDESGPDDGILVLRVRDNGIGIAEKNRERVFEMFKRLHRPSEFEGNGLGLAICRRIAHDHGGSIEVTAAPEVGSDFIVRLSK